MAAASAAAFLASCSVDSQSVVVTNDSELSRENETIELCMKKLQKADRSLTAENVIVCDCSGAQVPCQVYTETNGCVKLVFQASVEAGATANYVVKAGVREEFPMLAYSRHVPERKDDYAYENNKVAGRIYGPALDFPRTFGSDIWLKCTDRLVINDWFKKMDYHHNYGEGMDCYKVGGTLGGGALVPYSEGENFILGDNWATCQHICDGPIRTKAEFTYEAFDVDGKQYSAVRTIELDANSHFVKSVTTFKPVGHEADSLNLVLGAIQHDVLARHNGDCWIAFTEVASDTKQPEIDGNISVALVYDPAELADNKIQAVGDIAGHAAIITREAANKPITVWTGSGWSQAGIDSPMNWVVMTGDFAIAQANPLKVEILK